MINLKQVLAVLNNKSHLMDEQMKGRLWGLYQNLKNGKGATPLQTKVWEEFLEKEANEGEDPSTLPINEMAQIAKDTWEVQKEVALEKNALTKVQTDVDDLYKEQRNILETLSYMQDLLEYLAKKESDSLLKS